VPELFLIAPLKSGDQIPTEMGHLVTRLAPYRCQRNADELIRTKQTILHEAIDKVTKEDWISSVQHAKQVQDDSRSGPSQGTHRHKHLGGELSDRDGREDYGGGEPLSVPYYNCCILCLSVLRTRTEQGKTSYYIHAIDINMSMTRINLSCHCPPRVWQQSFAVTDLFPHRFKI
jgi:hypothetical protein